MRHSLRFGEVALAPSESFNEPGPLLLCRNPLGDVRDRAQHLRRLPGPVELQGAEPVDPAFRAGVGADDPILAVERPALTDDLVGEVGEHRLPVGRMNERGPARDRPVECGLDPEDRVEAQ